MTVRHDPLQHYPYKIASERCTVKRKQETSVRAGGEEFTAEDAENAEKEVMQTGCRKQGALGHP
jgi:hypothetical protein